MAKNEEFSNDREPRFTFGVRELEQAQVTQRFRAQGLSLTSTPRKSANDPRGFGFDPYNTSGSFDRKKNWERVRKR